jgi:magnesium transporter
MSLASFIERFTNVFCSVKAILDANRNSLMLLDLKFSIGTLGIGSGAFIAALYGMNLKNFIEESNVGFIGVTGWCVVFAGIVCSYGLTKLRKVQRVTMFAESGTKGRDWITDDTGLQLGRREREMRHRRLKEERLGALEERRMNLLQQRQEAAITASAALGKRDM